MAIEGRTTVYNNITSEEKLKEVNPDNLELGEDFLDYLKSVDRSPETIKQYRANLNIFWCWNLEYNKNKFFVDLTKREVSKFQNHIINTWGWSPKRVRVVKATLSSMSNYIENILDMDFPNFRNIINKIESPANDVVREKSVLQMEDVEWLLNQLTEKGDYMRACMVALAIFSGKRKAELTRFKVDYFDEKNLICDGALYKTPEKIKTKGRGSRGKLIDVYILAKPFKPYLDRWLNQRKELKIKSVWLFPKYKDGKWLNEAIGIPTMDSWAKTFNSMLQERGCTWYFHCARHFFTSYLLEQGIPDSIVQSIQSWSSGDMVRIYDDRSIDDQFSKYFGAEGIKQVEQKGLADL